MYCKMANTKENPFSLTLFNFKEDKSKSNSDGKFSNVPEFVDKYDPSVFCRTCGNVNPCLVPIFKDEGLDYSLNKKIEKYLPIQVSEEDDLPLQICYHCASILIAWDTLLIGCVEAEKKLISLKNSLGNKQCDDVVEDVVGLLNENIQNDDEPLNTKKAASRLEKIEERRDISQEKNDFQSSEAVDNGTEGFMEEPDLSFSTYQHLITMQRPFIFEILNLRIHNPYCCKMCITISNCKQRFLKYLKGLKSELKHEKVKSVISDDNFVTSETPAKEVTKRIRSKPSRVTCDICGRVLSCRFSLKNHMKIHFEGKTLRCDVCGKAFRHRFNLIRHLRVIHDGVRHICTVCGKPYRSQSEMEDHRNIHNVQRKYVCEECGQIFLTKASFYPHKRLHRVKNVKKDITFDCGVCQRNFTSNKARNEHMMIHTGEKPIVCDLCGKTFRTKTNYTQHAKVHSEVKPFVCDHCGKPFARKDHLRVHYRRHAGVKPFICDYCGKGFVQLDDMKKHSRTHKNKI